MGHEIEFAFEDSSRLVLVRGPQLTFSCERIAQKRLLSLLDRDNNKTRL